jgi:hypothetical protein
MQTVEPGALAEVPNLGFTFEADCRGAMGIAAGVARTDRHSSGVAVSRRVRALRDKSFWRRRFRAENELKFSVLT